VGEPVTTRGAYLDQLGARLNGSRRDRARLREEIQAHIDEATRRGVDEEAVIVALGSPDEVAAAWQARCDDNRAAIRRRVAVAATLVTAAAVLGVAQHAQGSRLKSPPSHRPAGTPTTTVSHQKTTPRFVGP
jgi:uncharacterized membrane protein